MSDERIAELKREAEEIKAKIKAEKDSLKDTTLVQYSKGMGVASMVDMGARRVKMSALLDCGRLHARSDGRR